MKKEKIKRRNERFTEDQIEAQRSGFDLERRSSGMRALCFLQKKQSKRYTACSDVVEVAGLEPTASASRTQRSTKLSHTSSYFFPDQGQIPDATMIIISEE